MKCDLEDRLQVRVVLACGSHHAEMALVERVKAATEYQPIRQVCKGLTV